MRRALTLSIASFLFLLVGLVGNGSADPVNSPRVSFGEIVCGDVTYTVVSPDGSPVGQMLTANGSNSTSVNIMIVDKAGSAFPQKLLTSCTFDDPPETGFFLITPVR